MTDTAAVILAAGKSTRMRTSVPKVLHTIAGRPMIAHVLDIVRPLAPARTVVVVGPDMEAVAAEVAPVETALQAAQRGTADAVQAARAALEGFAGTVLVLFGDSPLIRTETIEHMLAARQGAEVPAVVVLGFRPADTEPYGRLLQTPDGDLERIVETRDASAEERAVGLCNSGVMAIDGAVLFDLLDAIGTDNAQGEYYLTDIVAVARGKGLRCAVVEADAAELVGINSRAELAAAESAMQERLRTRAMAEGTTLRDPATVWLSADTVLGRDVTVGQNVVFGPGVTVGEGAVIEAFCHIEGAEIASGARVGPFARVRPGTRLAAGARIGNFVEVKNAELGDGAKVNHLSYVGDASVGPHANVGAGTITCNYDGVEKHRTEIGAGAFIGSNTALVAPVSVGSGAIVGAGSTITKDVDDDELTVTRAEQRHNPGGAARLRERKAKRKSAG